MIPSAYVYIWHTDGAGLKAKWPKVFGNRTVSLQDMFAIDSIEAGRAFFRQRLADNHKNGGIFGPIILRSSTLSPRHHDWLDDATQIGDVREVIENG